MNKKDLIEQLQKEIESGYVHFKNYDYIIKENYKNEWESAVDLFYENNYFSPLTENQKYFNIHCLFLEILKNEN